MFGVSRFRRWPVRRFCPLNQSHNCVKHSFVGKLLSGINYNHADVKALEELIGEVNEQAVDKSPELASLKSHLGQRNNTFQGAGTAELTPFPKKLRDLSKNFSVHFGDASGRADLVAPQPNPAR